MRDVTAWQTEEFERNRAHLRAVAYRILGWVAEADDALQEAWLRLNGSDTSAVENMRGWLTTIVSRVSLDMLRACRSRRERTPAATRQLASRARRRVRGAEPDPAAHTLAEQRRVVDAFLDAARNGDFDALVSVLDPDVVFRADRGALAPAVPAAVRGAAETARAVLSRGAPGAQFGRPAVVNGKAGVVVVRRGRLIAVLELTVVEHRIAALDLVIDPRKLARVRI